MSGAPVVRVVVEVSVRPEAAFEIFTAEIDRWWRPGPINWYDAYRAVSTRIEPGWAAAGWSSTTRPARRSRR